MKIYLTPSDVAELLATHWNKPVSAVKVLLTEEIPVDVPMSFFTADTPAIAPVAAEPSKPRAKRTTVAAKQVEQELADLAEMEELITSAPAKGQVDSFDAFIEEDEENFG